MSSNSIVGQIIDGKYKIDKQLGKGGMGTVYLATHIGTGRPVAVKVIAPDFMKREEFVERFRREAKAAGRLRHPNVVDVTDFGFAHKEDGEQVAYLVMEYLDGCTLGEVLDEEQRLPLEFSINILEQVCSAVEEAHRQGIIHRDLKPDNIWLEPNQRGGYTVKVLDFGIAKLEETKNLEHVEAEMSFSADKVPTNINNDALTMADEENSETLIEKKNSSTMVSENETIALIEESNTLLSENSEAGTIIQPVRSISNEIDPEDGTAILPANTTGAIDDIDGKRTKILGEPVATDKSLLQNSGTNELTRIGAVLGTPLYMSPEQCRGDKLTTRSDIYSLAVITYQMLSGKLPFAGDYKQVMAGHKNEEPPPLRAKKVSKRLKGIIMQSLSKKPEDRPETAEAFASKLRSNSEGIGVLLRRAVVIYSERLPKFLALSLLTFLPLIILTMMRVGFGFLIGFGVIEKGNITELIGFGFGVITFFLQIVSSAILVGMITWVVAQTLAYPLRPISLRAAFEKVKKRWKPLTGIVTLSTLLALSGFVAGAIGLPISFAFLLITLQVLAGSGITLVVGIVLAITGAVIFLVFMSSNFMLIAPSIMIEGIKGFNAFGRSVELVKRSYRTVFATAMLVYIFPAVITIIMAVAIGSFLGNFDKSKEIAKMRKEGVVAEKDQKKEKKEKKDDGASVSFSLDSGKGIEINSTDTTDKKKEEKSMERGIRQSLTEAILELLWTPLALLISSFTSVVTALIYFKTRQAGGESMQGLLERLDDSNQLQSKWQQRVRERLIQSGKLTGSTSNPSGSSLNK